MLEFVFMIGQSFNLFIEALTKFDEIYFLTVVLVVPLSS